MLQWPGEGQNRSGTHITATAGGHPGVGGGELLCGTQPGEPVVHPAHCIHPCHGREAFHRQVLVQETAGTTQKKKKSEVQKKLHHDYKRAPTQPSLQKALVYQEGQGAALVSGEQETGHYRTREGSNNKKLLPLQWVLSWGPLLWWMGQPVSRVQPAFMPAWTERFWERRCTEMLQTLPDSAHFKQSSKAYSWQPFLRTHTAWHR